MEKKKKLSSKRGITLVSLIIYIILTTMVLSMLSIVTSNFRSNINNVNIGTVEDVEFDKLNLQLLRETKNADNKIREQNSSETKVVFKSGNTYEYIEEDNAVYLNGNIKVADNIESCKFEIETTNTLSGMVSSENVKYTDKNGDVAVIPAGFAVSGKESEQTIEDGLVIYCGLQDTKQRLIATVKIMGQQRVTEYVLTNKGAIDWNDGTEVANAQKTYDQFVWIPIPRENINEMYMCQSEDGTKSCKITVQEVNGEEVAYCTTHSSTLMAGRLYATSYGSETFNAELTSQKYYKTSSVKQALREPDVILNNPDSDEDSTTNEDGVYIYIKIIDQILGTNYNSVDGFKDALQSEYNEIVKSVYENEGFYIGRYETSNMTEQDGTAIKVVSGTTSGTGGLNWYYMYAQQREYATNKGLEVGSTMIQGAAYDQVMKFVNTDSYNVTTANNVGHTQADFKIYPYQTGGRDYSTNYKGTVEYRDVSKNIYDLEGNLSAWTMECISTSGRQYRGGSYSRAYSASYRTNGGWLPRILKYVGSIAQLYIK